MISILHIWLILNSPVNEVKLCSPDQNWVQEALGVSPVDSFPGLFQEWADISPGLIHEWTDPP